MLLIRDAQPDDAEALVGLIAELDFKVTAQAVAERLELLDRLGQPALVAEEDGIVGCLTWNIMRVLHRDTPVGRISMLVVDATKRSAGIGAKLVAEAETRMAAAGCKLVELTSNEKRLDAHRFYERLGYERTSLRFGKTIGGMMC